GTVRLVRGRAAVTGARGGRYLTCAEKGAGFPVGPREARLQQRGVEIGAFARLQALDVGGEDRVERGRARGDVVHRYADLGGTAARLPGHGHDPAHALRDDVEAAFLAVRAGLPEAGHRAIDDVRVDLPDGFVVDPELAGNAGAVVLHDDVRVAGELQEY